jgi:hypothetical protein
MVMLPFDKDVEDLYRLTMMTLGGILYCSDEKIDSVPVFAWKLGHIKEKQREHPITLAVGKTVDSYGIYKKMKKFVGSSQLTEPERLQLLKDMVDEFKIYIANMKDLHRRKLRTMDSINRKNIIMIGEDADHQREVGEYPSVFMHSGTSPVIVRPSTVRRPYHLFYEDNAAGGGDWKSIMERTDQLLSCWFHTPLQTWRIDWSGENCTVFHNPDFEKIEYDWMEGNFEKSEESMHCLLEDTFFGVCAMESLIEESSEILDEMTAWRALPCCMALHCRLGSRSPMQWLSADVLKMIMNF